LAKSKWDPALCERLIEHGKNGLSFAAFAGVAGVSRKTLYQWLEEREDFRAAKDIADGLHLLAWEKIGLGLATGKLKGSGVAFIHQICNRFPDLYRQRLEVDAKHSGAIGISRVSKSEEWTDEELEQQIEELTAIATER
jgi:hypothetical protein